MCVTVTGAVNGAGISIAEWRWCPKGYKTPCSCTERAKNTFAWLYGEQGLPTGDASAAVSFPLTECHDADITFQRYLTPERSGDVDRTFTLVTKASNLRLRFFIAASVGAGGVRLGRPLPPNFTLRNKAFCLSRNRSYTRMESIGHGRVQQPCPPFKASPRHLWRHELVVSVRRSSLCISLFLPLRGVL